MEKKNISIAWAKFSNYKNSSLIGKDVLALHSEDLILFYNLNTGNTKYYRASNQNDYGNGISCFCGHKIYQIFAISEKCLRSRILLIKYSNFEKFQTLSEGDSNIAGNYLDMCFTETEILIGLTGYPDYCIKIWNYRLGQLLNVTKTNIESQIQTINCSSFEPITIIQCAKNLGLINVWEMHLILDEALIINRPINFSMFFKRKLNISYVFGEDGWIYFIDKCGNLRGMTIGGGGSSVIGAQPKLLYENNNNNNHGDYEEVININLAYYKGGCIIANNSNCEIFFIKKIMMMDNTVADRWSIVWNVIIDNPICKMFSITNSDQFYAIDNFGNILRMEEENEKYKCCNSSDNGDGDGDGDGGGSTTGNGGTKTIKFKIINENDQRYCVKYFDILNPDTKYIAIIADQINDIILLDITNGKKISSFNIIHNNNNNNNKMITCICSHPLYPVIAIGDNYGFVYIVSFVNEMNPFLLKKFYLSTSEMNTIKFSSLFGYYLVSLDNNQNFFIIYGSSIIENNYNIISNITYNDTNSIIISYSLHEIYYNNNDQNHNNNNNNNVDNGIKICILLYNENDDTKKSLSTEHLEILTLEKPNFNIDTQTIYLSDHYIQAELLIRNWYNSNFNLNIIGSLYLDRNINVLHINDDNNDLVKIVSTIRTVHQLKHVLFHIQSMKYLITWGADRLVCVYNLDTLKLEILFFASNHRDNEIQKVRCSNDGEYFIILQSNGCLKCVNLKSIFKIEIPEIYNNKTELNFIKSATTEDGDNDNLNLEHEHEEEKTWLEIKAQKEYDNEVEMYRPIKDSILNDFLELKNKMKILIDNNEKEIPEHQISIRNYNLSPEQTESILEMARRERDIEEHHLNVYIEDLKNTHNWIIDNTWNRMDIKYSILCGIFKNFECENYGLTYTQSEHNNDHVKKVILLRSIELCTSEQNVFRPWIPQTKENLEMLSQEPDLTDVIAHADITITTSATIINPAAAADTSSNRSSISGSFKNKINLSSIMNEFVNVCMYNNSDNKRNKSYVFSGTTTHNFIEPSINRYRQVETVTFQQMFFEKILSNYDILNLRKCFNQKFHEMKYLKGEYIEEIKYKNKRLHYVQNELNILAKLLMEELEYFEEIPDPSFRPEEEPSSIIKVEDNEINAVPYVSPSMQKLIDEDALREEQKRLALLADNFRQRALIVMMDGVLEKRWEDEIKIDPELPECIKNYKNPDDYTKDDIKTVQEYEEKLNFIRSERKRYQKILKEEQIRIKSLRDDQITKFNRNCKELFTLKLHVDSAIKQEEIKLIRYQMFNLKRIQIKQKQEMIIKDLLQDKCKIEKLQKLIDDLDKKLQNIQNRYEQLLARDKILDKQFKMQFGELTSASSAFIEAIYKIFRKRPKWIQRAWETNAILLDLSNRILTKNTLQNGCPLPNECYEYLNLLNSNDNYSHAPNTIDRILWKSICIIRRQKIESEFKTKACGIQLVEAETTLNHYVKELNMKKNSYTVINRELNELKKQYYNHLQNTSLQIVLPLGLVEIPLTGHIIDFDGTSLIKLSDIENINIKIRKAGAIKLNVMNKLAVFRRKINYQEWEHKSSRLLLDRVKQKLKVIENIKVTVEMKACLREWQKQHEIQELSTISLENELNSRRKIFQKYLKEMDDKIKNIKEKISMQKQESVIYDNRIQRINIEINQQNLLHDVELKKHEINERKERMKTILERASLVRKIQGQHAHILELIAILELQRLRTFPTLSSIKNPV